MTDTSEAPALEPDVPEPPKPPPVEPLPVQGSEGLPSDVKNGDAGPGEDDPAIAQEPPTEDNQP